MKNTLSNTIPNNKPVYSISVVAETLSIHQRTARIYDDNGLLSPARTPKNRRLYSLDDIEKGKFIQYLTRELGINLAGIKIIFELLKDVKDIPAGREMEHIKDIAKCLGITSEMQAESKEKLSKRGRKKSVVIV